MTTTSALYIADQRDGLRCYTGMRRHLQSERPNATACGADARYMTPVDEEDIELYPQCGSCGLKLVWQRMKALQA